MTRAYLGIDIGGTKSHALLIDENGTPIGDGRAGAGNHEQVGYDGLAAVLEQITGEALAQAGLTGADIAGAGFGLCGYDWPSERAAHETAIAALRLRAPVELVNDAMIGLIAGAENGWGVGVVAGTSCNCWGRDAAGRLGHAVGMGQMVGEAGGAGELVARAVWAISRAYTLAAPPTRLTAAFMEVARFSDAEAMIEAYCEGHLHFTAAYAPIVFAVANGGDPVALDLVAWTGTELGNLALAVTRQLTLQNEAFEVVMAGRYFNGHPLVAERLRAQVSADAPRARFTRLDAPPVIGAALLGMEAAGCTPDVRASARRRLHEAAHDNLWFRGEAVTPPPIPA